MASAAAPSVPPFHGGNISLSVHQHTHQDKQELQSNSGERLFIDIASYIVTIKVHDNLIGTIEVLVAEQSAESPVTLGEMYRQHHAHNASMAIPQGIEDYLINGRFPEDKDAKIRGVEAIVFITEVQIEQPYRGRGISLLAVDLLIGKLSLDLTKGVVILQPGALHGPTDLAGRFEAEAKLTRHWKQMGFEEWSNDGREFLCMPTAYHERPTIENVVPGLFLERRETTLDIQGSARSRVLQNVFSR